MTTEEIDIAYETKLAPRNFSKAKGTVQGSSGELDKSASV
jgi:hypothetical protein